MPARGSPGPDTSDTGGDEGLFIPSRGTRRRSRPVAPPVLRRGEVETPVSRLGSPAGGTMSRPLVAVVGLGLMLAVGIGLRPAGAHPGGLDASGCHTNRKTGDYHCHRPGAAPRTRAPPVAPPATQSPPPGCTGRLGPGNLPEALARHHSLVHLRFRPNLRRSARRTFLSDTLGLQALPATRLTR